MFSEEDKRVVICLEGVVRLLKQIFQYMENGIWMVLIYYMGGNEEWCVDIVVWRREGGFLSLYGGQLGEVMQMMMGFKMVYMLFDLVSYLRNGLFFKERFGGKRGWDR